VAILSEAARALGSNRAAVALYAVLSVGAGAAVSLCDTVTADGLFFAVSPFVQRASQFVTDVFLAAAVACASSVAFSRMGADIDRPFWKMPSDREALRRFFALWFVLALSQLTALRLLSLTTETSPFRTWVKILFLLTVLLSTPMGACNVFPGEFRWERFVQNLAPFLSRFTNALAVLFVNFVLFFAYLALAGWVAEQPEFRTAFWPQSVIDAIFCVADCYVFAATWLICMAHRREMEENQRYSDYDI
jgi:preprotein translocase subunit SecG